MVPNTKKVGPLLLHPNTNYLTIPFFHLLVPQNINCDFHYLIQDKHRINNEYNEFKLRISMHLTVQQHKEPNLLRMATKSPSGPTSATLVQSPICPLASSSMANTMGKDIFTKLPSFILRQLKCKLCKYSSSLIKPLRGLAHPSLTTCTHSTSILLNLTFGSAPAAAIFAALWLSGTTRSTSAPPSGSMRELLTITEGFSEQGFGKD